MNCKKVIFLMIVLLMTIFIVACGNSFKQQDAVENDKDKLIGEERHDKNDEDVHEQSVNDTDSSVKDEPTHYFTGTIEEMISDNLAIVLASLAENNPVGLVFVDLSVSNYDTFQVGDRIKVGFDGIIMESSPAQIKTLSVELVEEP